MERAKTPKYSLIAVSQQRHVRLWLRIGAMPLKKPAEQQASLINTCLPPAFPMLE
jgi:hypothetical protein